MTPKQSQRLIKKIADIKRALAAQKRTFSGYDDSRGLRYLPTRYYLQLADYKGRLTYTRWFAKTFPDDIGFADFCLSGPCCSLSRASLPRPKPKAGKLSVPIRMYWISSLAIPFTHSQNMNGLIWLRLVSRRISLIRTSNPS